MLRAGARIIKCGTALGAREQMVQKVLEETGTCVISFFLVWFTSYFCFL